MGSEVIIANENSALAYIKGNPQWPGISGKTTGFTSFLWGFHAGASRFCGNSLAVLWTAKTVYPEILTTVNMAEEVDNFYRTFFNFELSDEQIEKILKGRFMNQNKGRLPV